MMGASRSVLKARCDSFGLVVRLLFWVYAVYFVVMLGIGILMCSFPSGEFMIRVMDTGNGLAGYGFFHGNLEIDFVRNAVSESAVNAPKLVYLVGYFCGLPVNLCYLLILRNIAAIFKMIDKNDSPFVSRSCKMVLHIGFLVILSGVLKYGLASTLLAILRYGNGSSNSANWWGYLITGCVIICFSYIFEYGTTLQTESDETL